MKKETKIEIFFWLVVVFVFSPRVLLEVYEHKLKNSLTPFENNEWTVKDKDGNVIYDKLTLPYDLRWKEQKTNRREWIFEKEVRTDQLKNIVDLGIVLGRVGDSDYVMFNDCMIGSTAFNTESKYREGWGWSRLRNYQVPNNCIKYPTSTISYHIYKTFGPGYGVFAGPFGFYQFSDIQKNAGIVDFLKYTMLAVFGLGLIFFIGIQYFLIYLSSERREIYRIFSMLSISVGIYLFLTSVYPFLFFRSVSFCIKALFGSALASTIFFLVFFRKKFQILSREFIFIYALISGIIFIYALVRNDPNEVYKYYEYWHPLFLIAFVISYVQMFLHRNQGRESSYYSKYLLAFSIFIVCCVHDVVVSILAYSNSYLIGYAFTFFVLVVGLTLSREYSDSFSKVEDLVIRRTDELNRALAGIQKIQNLKDDQANRFAHDIRSPLAALQVLKEVISTHLSDDEKGLLKHTIIRINDLANTALPKMIGVESGSFTLQSAVFLWPVLDKLISEKRLEYKHLPDLTIELKNISPIFELHAKCEEIEFTRMISNLVNNSIEARSSNRPIFISIEIIKKQNQIEICICDNGKGIPGEIVAKLFDKGFTYGKRGGKGVGLKHAKSTIEAWNGIIQVESSEKIGTEIRFQIPSSESPEWLLTKLELFGISNLVVIDDQPFVINTWKQKLQEFNPQPSIFWVQNMEGWGQSEVSGLNRQRTFFLVDHDLSTSVTGLDMIRELKLAPRVVLVTGNDDDLILRKRVMDLGVKILPKSLIHAINVEF